MQGHIFIQEAPDELDVDDLRTHLQTSGCGAIVSFTGITRGEDDGEEVLRLEFDAWQDKLSETLHSLAEQAIDRFGLKSVAMAHRTGSVGPGENIVAIHVASPHRKEAFEGCSWLIDELKGQAPCGKKKSSQAGQHGKQDWGEKMEKSIQGVIDIGGKPIVHRRASATG